MNINNNINSNFDVFDISKIIDILFLKKFLIIFISFIFFVAGISYSLLLEDRYTSSTFLQVNSEDAQSSASVLSSFSSGLGGLGGFAGINGSASRADYAVAVINSKEFLSYLFLLDDLKQNVIAIESFDKNDNTVTFNSEIFNSESKTFLGEYSSEDFALNKFFEILAKDLKITKDNKTQFISISYTHKSPLFSKFFLDTLLKELNEIIRKKELERSTNSINYLINISSQTLNNEMRTAISQLIETELKKQMLANISKNYLLDPIDIPFKPIKKSEPTRSIISILFGLFGGLLSSLFFIVSGLRSKEF